MIKLFTDSSSNLTAEELDKYEIEFLPYTIEIDGKEYLSDLYWKGISPEQITKALLSKNTAMSHRPPLNVWKEKIEKYILLGYDILYLALSQGTTSSLMTFDIIRGMLESEGKLSPLQRMVGTDTLTAATLQGVITLEVAKALKAGISIDDAVELTKQLREKGHLMECVISAQQIVTTGRSKEESLVSTYPIMAVVNKLPVPIASFLNEEEALISLVDNLPTNNDTLKISVDPTCPLERLNIFKSLLEKKLPNQRIDFCSPTILTVMGHGVIGAAWVD